jgi:methionine aminotransferase
VAFVRDRTALSDLGDLAYCQRLATEVGVAAIPMSAFYEQAPEMRVIRFCFAKKEATLDAALARLQALKA